MLGRQMASCADSSTETSKSVDQSWVVVKFGGTSVSFGDTWQQIVNRVRELQNPAQGNNFKVLLVLSALTQVLDAFLSSLS